MSASSEAVSGAHSGGLAITASPAASAGAIRHVASISGAFHGVTHTRTGSQLTWFEWPRVSKSSTRRACPDGRRRSGSCSRPAGSRSSSSSGGGAVVARLDLGDLGRRSSISSPTDGGSRRAPSATSNPRSRSPSWRRRRPGRPRPAPTGDLGDRPLVDRRDVGERRRSDPFPADPVLGRDLDPSTSTRPLSVVPPSSRRGTVWTTRERCQTAARAAEAQPIVTVPCMPRRSGRGGGSRRSASRRSSGTCRSSRRSRPPARRPLRAGGRGGPRSPSRGRPARWSPRMNSWSIGSVFTITKRTVSPGSTARPSGSNDE